MTYQGFVSWRPAIFPPRGDWEVLADPLVPPAHGRAGYVRRCQTLGSVSPSCLSWWSSYWAADVLSAWKDGDLASVIPFSYNNWWLRTDFRFGPGPGGRELDHRLHR